MDNNEILRTYLIGFFLLIGSHNTIAAPVVYTNEALFLSDLADLGYTVIHEGFEDNATWGSYRNLQSFPGRAPSVTSQGIIWQSNYATNNITTGSVGNSAPEGNYAIYSLDHGMTTDSLGCDAAEDPNIPAECYQNDGLKVETETGDLIFAFGGKVDTANSGKITFLLDGIDVNANDTDNIDNWQREGDWADNWSFVGVIDTDGFLSAELRELRGKDLDQVLLFADDFTIGVSAVPIPAAAWLFCSGLLGLIGFNKRKRSS
jgi:hypothetical protein